VQQPFAAQGVAANVCDATRLNKTTEDWLKILFFNYKKIIAAFKQFVGKNYLSNKPNF
jgi:hypothetical protein